MRKAILIVLCSCGPALAGGWLKQSTAATIMFGPFVDKTDGVTLKTDSTTITDIDHASTGIFLSKAGGTAAIRHASVTASVADAYGMMKVTLDTTDTNTLGRLDVLFAKAATYLPVSDSYMVLPANVYDSLVAGSATLSVDATKVGGTSQTGRDIGASVLLSSGTGTGQVSLSSGAVLLQATQTGVTIPTVTTLTNLPAITSNWLTAAGLASDAVAEIQSGLATSGGTFTAIGGSEMLRVPPGNNATIQFSLFDGSTFITGQSLTLTIVRRSDRYYWTGSAWQASPAATVNMTETATIDGLYYYTLTSAAIGTTTPEFFDWSSTYNSTVTNRGVVACESVQVSDLTTAALAAFVTDDTGETEAVTGSVGDLSGGAASGGLTVEESGWLETIYGRSASTTVTIQSPVASNGTLTLINGMDYLGGTLTATRTSWAGESMVGGTANLYIMTRAVYDAGTGAAALGPVACTFTNGGVGTTIVVTMPLTAAQTAALTPSPAQNPLNYVYQVIGTTSGGHKYSLLGPAACTVKRGLN